MRSNPQHHDIGRHPPALASRIFFTMPANRQPWRTEGDGRQPAGAFDFCRDLEALSLPDFALKRKCTLSERSEFGHFRFAFSKIQ